MEINVSKFMGCSKSRCQKFIAIKAYLKNKKIFKQPDFTLEETRGGKSPKLLEGRK